MLSKTEGLYLSGQIAVSKSYEYKLKSIIKRKISNQLKKEIPLLSSLFPNNPELTKFGKIIGEGKETDLTEISKADNNNCSEQSY
ncbi:MAG: hypothetical protein H0X50_03375 [Nitrosopumilus sp.]|nr:hypothetical protein [Nitrosopumilus sp.]